MLPVGNGDKGLWVSGPEPPERADWKLAGGSAEPSSISSDTLAMLLACSLSDDEFCKQAYPSWDVTLGPLQ